MAKYKLKEIEVGDVKVKGGTKSTVTSIDPETGAITWDVTTVPEMDTTFKKFAQLRDYIEDLASDKKEDPKFREIAKKVIATFNDFRTHLRKNYPDEYETFKSVAEDLAKTLNEESTIASNSFLRAVFLLKFVKIIAFSSPLASLYFLANAFISLVNKASSSFALARPLVDLSTFFNSDLDGSLNPLKTAYNPTLFILFVISG